MVTVANPSPHLLLVVTEDWYYWSHRRALARAAIQVGFRVSLLSNFGELRSAIEADGVTTVDLPFQRRGRNPVQELLGIRDMAAVYRRLGPDIVHHVAIKPVLYGSIAAHAAGIPAVVNAISGLGFVFTGRGPRAAAIRPLVTQWYRRALGRPNAVTIFQNADDRSAFVERGLVREQQSVLIAGCGVDVNVFRPSAKNNPIPVVIYSGRMLWSKGVGDLVAAARILRDRGVKLKVELVGHSDRDNPEAVPEETIRSWEEPGFITWRGRRSDMPEMLAGADIAVLASEREGIPKSLLEAAAAGLPLVATDVPGCRDVVEHGVNGFLARVHSADSLAEMLEPLALDGALRTRMGAESRRKAERMFDEKLVIQQTLALYRKMSSAA